MNKDTGDAAQDEETAIAETQPTSERIPLWLWPNLLSLDAPVVAVSWMWLFAESFKISLLTDVYVALFLAVWTIYVADRLFDATRIVDLAQSTARHRFYKENFTFFAVLGAFSGSGAVTLALTRLSTELLARSIVGVLLVALYFVFRIAAIRSRTDTPRELLCGIVFAFGTVLPVYVYAGDETSIIYTAHPAMFALLCSLNCFFIAWWERDADAANLDHSSVTRLPNGGAYIRAGGIALAVAALVLRYLNFPEFGWAIHTAIFVSAAALVLLSKFEDRLGPRALRVLADVALLSPLIITPIVKASLGR